MQRRQASRQSPPHRKGICRSRPQRSDFESAAGDRSLPCPEIGGKGATHQVIHGPEYEQAGDDATSRKPASGVSLSIARNSTVPVLSAQVHL